MQNVQARINEMIHIIKNSPVDYVVNNHEFIEAIYQKSNYEIFSPSYARAKIYKAGLIDGIRLERARKKETRINKNKQLEDIQELSCIFTILTRQSQQQLLSFSRGLLRNKYQKEAI